MEHTPTRTRQFEAIFDTHHRAILAYALRRTTKREDAADIVADTFLVAWRRLDDMPSGADAAQCHGDPAGSGAPTSAATWVASRRRAGIRTGDGG